MKSEMWLDEKAVLAAVKQAQIKPVQKAAALVEATMKQKLSVGGRKKRKALRRKRNKKGQLRSRTISVSESSKPGEPPHAQTGVLRSSIASAMLPKGSAIVGPQSPPAHYGAYLEYGTRKMEPRPFARPSLIETKGKFPWLWRKLKLAHTVTGRKLNRRKK